MDRINPFILLLLIALFTCNGLLAQESNWQRFKKLSRPEKYWAIFHPFAVKRAMNVTREALNVTDSINQTGIIGSDDNGGLVDAFRHGYWMLRLTDEIGKRRALGLGRKHEKGNYLQYKKGKLEEGSVPDLASQEMDLFNNEVGSKLGNQSNEKRSKANMVISGLRFGQFKIIKKNENGNSLNANGEIIPQEKWEGLWENDRCIVTSNEAIIVKP